MTAGGVVSVGSHRHIPVCTCTCMFCAACRRRDGMEAAGSFLRPTLPPAVSLHSVVLCLLEYTQTARSLICAVSDVTVLHYCRHRHKMCSGHIYLLFYDVKFPKRRGARPDLSSRERDALNQTSDKALSYEQPSLLPHRS